MAQHSLAENFNYFFNRLNPSESFVEIASREYNTAKDLIEDLNGLASEIGPTCFLQGSYQRDTAIYTINDVDIVALCTKLSHPPSGGTGKSYSRDEIFDLIAAPLKNHGHYEGKVNYNSKSMCIKIDLEIKLEILPVVFKSGNCDPQVEPFRLYRPESGKWEDGFARYHQKHLTEKNQQADSNFIPAIKVFKHLRFRYSLGTVSFHLECLLHSIPNSYFRGPPADYISSILSYIASKSSSDWYKQNILTPCEDRRLFTDSEWEQDNWKNFYDHVETWAKAAKYAKETNDRDEAIDMWQTLLGESFFPKEISG